PGRGRRGRCRCNRAVSSRRRVPRPRRACAGGRQKKAVRRDSWWPRDRHCLPGRRHLRQDRLWRRVPPCGKRPPPLRRCRPLHGPGTRRQRARPSQGRPRESVRGEVGGVKRQYGKPPALAAENPGPQPFWIATEHILVLGDKYVPGTRTDLVGELAGTPARITGEDTDLSERNGNVVGVLMQVDRAESAVEGSEPGCLCSVGELGSPDADRRARLHGATVEKNRRCGREAPPSRNDLVDRDRT